MLVEFLINNQVIVLASSACLLCCLMLIKQHKLLLASVTVQNKMQIQLEALQQQQHVNSNNWQSQLSQIQQNLLQNKQQNNDSLHELKRYFEQQVAELKIKILRQLAEQAQLQQTSHNQFNQQINSLLQQHKQQFNDNQLKAVDQLVEHLNKSTLASRDELTKALKENSEILSKRFDRLTTSTDSRLKDISLQVEQRLADGFDKTTKTFNDILKRLALIDDAQKKITELSSNVVSLQEVLADKRSRGAFGEVQLNALLRNVLPEQHFSLQHTLSNNKIADCLLKLPKPTGNIVIDAKFPLESFKKMMDNSLANSDRKAAERQFKLDIKKHINDISHKYIIEEETADGAIMFLPAEAVFAEIHAHHSDLVELANNKRVWITSPTTLMAILTTARSVLKDEATREQIHIIKAHLSDLAADFGRFRTRFDNLAKHIDQAASDVKQIHTSANKISNRFEKIEQVELDNKKVVATLEVAE